MLHIFFLSILFQTKPLPVINSTVVRSPEEYSTSISAYKKNEFWGIWALPISENYRASSTKTAEGKNVYRVNNLQDYNLNTAWIPGANTKIANACLEYIFQFPANTSYAGAYQFQGICNLFNGYCKSQQIWNANSRVKKMLVYYNDIPLCYVNILDTWHFQSFDISRFFKNRRFDKNLDARFEIKNGDRLKFEIVESYKGIKYNDVAISEFLCDGAGN